MVLEAHITGFRAIPYRTFKRDNEIVEIIEPKISLEQGLREAVRLLGKHYDVLGLFGMFFVVLGDFIKIKLKNPLRSIEAQFCSEAVVRILRSAKYPGSDALNPNDSSPKDIYQLLVDGRRWYMDNLKAT